MSNDQPFRLTDANYIVYAAKNYVSYCLDDMEFYNDLNRVKFIKKVLSRYKKTGEINERLVINHMVIMYNVFNTKSCTKLLAFKLHQYLPQLFSILKFMNKLPDQITGIEDYPINTHTVAIDEKLYAILTKSLKQNNDL